MFEGLIHVSKDFSRVLDDASAKDASMIVILWDEHSLRDADSE